MRSGGKGHAAEHGYSVCTRLTRSLPDLIIINQLIIFIFIFYLRENSSPAAKCRSVKAKSWIAPDGCPAGCEVQSEEGHGQSKLGGSIANNDSRA